MFREVIINPVMNGFEMTINLPEGAQELVFNGLDDLLNELKAYYKDPDAAEDGYRQHPHARHLIARDESRELFGSWANGSGTASESPSYNLSSPSTTSSQRVVDTLHSPGPRPR